MAAAIRSDPDHVRCRELLETAAETLVVPVLVVAEAAYLLARQLGHGADAALYRSFDRGELEAMPVMEEDWARMGELVETYADLGLGGVDASVIAAAERIDVTTIATLDRRHFGVVQPRHVPAFSIVPDVFEARD